MRMGMVLLGAASSTPSKYTFFCRRYINLVWHSYPRRFFSHIIITTFILHINKTLLFEVHIQVTCYERRMGN